MADVSLGRPFCFLGLLSFCVPFLLCAWTFLGRLLLPLMNHRSACFSAPLALNCLSPHLSLPTRHLSLRFSAGSFNPIDVSTVQAAFPRDLFSVVSQTPLIPMPPS